MVRAKFKTSKNEDSVAWFIASIDDDARRCDTQQVCALVTEITGEKPAMWGKSIIGFGTYEYKYTSGREGTWMRIGMSPRKANLTLYIMDGFSDYRKLLTRLGKHSTGKSCLYIKTLADIDIEVLRELVHKSFFEAKAMGEKSD